MIILYNKLKIKYNVLFQIDNSKNLLKLAVKENLIMNLRDYLFDFQTNMLLYVYDNNNSIENCFKILAATALLINKSINLFIEESSSYRLLIDSIIIAKTYCMKKYEKSIIINSLHIVNSKYN